MTQDFGYEKHADDTRMNSVWLLKRIVLFSSYYRLASSVWNLDGDDDALWQKV